MMDGIDAFWYFRWRGDGEKDITVALHPLGTHQRRDNLKTRLSDLYCMNARMVCDLKQWSMSLIRFLEMRHFYQEVFGSSQQIYRKMNVLKVFFYLCFHFLFIKFNFLFPILRFLFLGVLFFLSSSFVSILWILTNICVFPILSFYF